jgi:hypothetical protein
MTLFLCAGGTVSLPAPDSALVNRSDGGHLIVSPARDVSERSELSADELHHWSDLVAATGWAMLQSLPQLEGGCLNYWEAGNWALHEQAEPVGPKTVVAHRRVHLHVLGRSRTAVHPSWLWGEAPLFPRFSDRKTWSSAFELLTTAECRTIAERLSERLRTV